MPGKRQQESLVLLQTAWLCVGLGKLGLLLLSMILPSPVASRAAGSWVHVPDPALPTGWYCSGSYEEIEVVSSK